MTSWKILRRGGMRIDYRCGHLAHRIAVFLLEGPAGREWFLRSVPRPAQDAHDCPDCLRDLLQASADADPASLDALIRPLES